MADNSTNIHPINFAINAYVARSGLMSSEMIRGFFGEPTPKDAPFRAAVIYNTPGLDEWLDFQEDFMEFNPVYGLQVMGDNLYVVFGLNLYKVTRTKTITLLGTLGTTPAPVQMTENGVQVTILTVSGNSYYYDNSSNTFAQITSPNYQLASSVTTLDGYTVFSVIDSGEWFISALRDTTTYAALDTATAEALSDNIVRIVTFNRQLYIFGTNSIEIWYNTGNVTFPFQRVDGVLIQRGLGAADSTAIEVDGVYWVGEDKKVYRTRNYIPEVISTFAIEYKLSQLSRIDDLVSFIYTESGHKFYVITSPSGQWTIKFDITTELWSEDGSLNAAQTEVQEWICQHQAYFNGLNIVNGRTNGKLYNLNIDTYSEAGTPIIRKAISCTQFEDSYNYKFIDRLALMMDFGVGIDGSGQGINPKVMMRFSIDGAKTWSNETMASIGDIGAYETELYWERLGKCRSIIIEITISDPVKATIISGYLKTREGAF
ncbi:MAG: hypothetical protein VKL60_18095 [Sphaerospermopsis sp.]|nr:hypothetical protein [Sphaerospermopsis sp.]